MLSPAIAQRTGVNKSVSFARWQQGPGFVVPRTTACYLFTSTRYKCVPRRESGLNTCSKPHWLSACVAQSVALRAATPDRGSNPGTSRHFFVFFFFITPLNSVFGLFSNIKPLQCERFTGLSKGNKGPPGLGLGLGPLRLRTGTDCCSRCNNATGIVERKDFTYY